MAHRHTTTVRARRTVGCALAMAWALAACSTQQAYDTGQAWRQNECNKLTDMNARQRCMHDASQPYDSYQRDVDQLKK